MTELNYGRRAGTRTNARSTCFTSSGQQHFTAGAVKGIADYFIRGDDVPEKREKTAYNRELDSRRRQNTA